MAAAWLLQAIYASMLGGQTLNGGGDDLHLLSNTTYGTVRGFAELAGQRTVVKFYGIPFAKPPVGDLRFKAPEIPAPWNGIRDATKFGNECLQRSLKSLNDVNKMVSRDEDCLYLNVYSPSRLPTEGDLAVMVWIHGGAYYIGSGSAYDATSLAAKGVVVVTINYRLDSFGFLSTEDDVMPGNFGMLDQILALKWVQNNIASFGGDPKKVTIFGESAGSSSVSLLTMSPLSKDLFQRAIMESGVSLSPWAVIHPAKLITPLTVARLVSSSLGCHDRDTSQLLLCLQKVDAETLLNKTVELDAVLGSGLTMVPRVENTFGFLPDLPVRLLARGQINHVDTIHGFNTDEMGYKPNVTISPDVFREDMVEMLSQFAIIDREQILQQLQNIYVDNMTDPLVLRSRLVAAVSDFNFIGPITLEIDHISSKSPEKHHYLYEFNHRASFSKKPQWLTAVHAEELQYLFDFNGPFSNFSKIANADDKLVSEQMKESWTNFAKTGNPNNPAAFGGTMWRGYSTSSPNYLKIKTRSELLQFRRPQVAKLFKKLIEKLDTALDPASTIVG